ncbi:MAG: chloride channel protein [Haloferacaceae archaeon]
MDVLRGDGSVVETSLTMFEQAASKDSIPLYLVGFVVGIIAGIGAIVFRVAIWIFQVVFFGSALNPGSVEFSMSRLPAVLGGYSLAGVPDLYRSFVALGVWRFVLIPAVGGLLVGLYIYATSPEVEGHGTDRTLEALLVRGGHVDTSLAFHKIVASSIAIASGASLGREGPIVQIGSAVGAYFSKFVNNRYRRILVAAGAGAGIAGTFNAPLAGMLFAVEVLLVEYDIRSLIVIGIASAMAVVVVRPVLPFTSTLGTELFTPTHPLHVVDPLVEYPLYIVLGLLVAVIGWAEVSVLYGVGDYFDRLDIPRYVKPAIGAGLLGVTVLITAGISRLSNSAGLTSLQSANWLFGVGYNTIHAVVSTNRFAIGLLVVFAIMKIAGFALSIGSGSSGGVFSPSLFIGAMAGGAFGILVQAIPGTASPAAYALVGMGGVFAAAARAPLTAMLITVELSGQYTLILPLLLVCVMGSELTDTFDLQGSIYTEALNRMGYDIHNRRIGSIEDFTPTDVMAIGIETVTPDTPIELAVERLTETSQRALPVLESGEVAGILTVSDVTSLANEGKSSSAPPMVFDGGGTVASSPGTTVEDVATDDVVTITADANLLEAVHKMKTMDISQLPVVDGDGTFLGLLSEGDVLNAYDKSLLK